jgi:CubicO group peptidase (beta-lactamase class C family)|tara:strand:- start:369 stop:1637 length:1269 start_codon:yes stop_codon:yes gene_type:complete
MACQSVLNKINTSFADLSFIKDIAIPADLELATNYGQEASAASVGVASEQMQNVWQAVENLYKTRMYNMVGFSLRRQGQLIFNRSLGMASGQYGELAAKAATVDTPVCLFSASKVISALLLLKLEELGQLSMHHTISHYIPNFGAHGKKDLTLENLVSHRAKVPTLEFENAEQLTDHDLILSMLCDQKPHKKKQAYHAVTGGFIVGEIIQIVTGQSIEKALDKYFRKPLKMKYFTYGVAKKYRNKAAQNHFSGLPLPHPISKLPKSILGFEFEEVIIRSNEELFQSSALPSANMYATSEECTRFYQMILNDGSYDGVEVLKSETVRKALKGYILPGFDSTLKIPMSFSRGGFMLNHKSVPLFGLKAKQAFGHLGFMNVMNWADPEREISVAVMTSGKPTVGPHLASLLNVGNTITRNFSKLS